MDAGPLPPRRTPAPPWRPPGCDHVALILQGGGALGAYQGGVYQALHEGGIEPDWVAGVSIGGINAAIIAGNRPERRIERLRSFWETVTARPVWPVLPDGDALRRAHNAWASLLSLTLGQPGFFTPNPVNPWLAPRGAEGATSFYSSAPLRETLLALVDFKLLNSGGVRYAAGAVDVASGNFAYFDTAQTTITPEHVMASGALPPALPMVRIGTDAYWDGGLVSNTPLQHLLENAADNGILVFQVDLFSARGPLPRDMPDVMSRMKDIQFSSRTRMATDVARRIMTRKIQLKRLLAKLPDDALSDEERALKTELAELPEFTILQLIYQARAYEGQAKDYEFSAASMREHWESGLRDTQQTLQRRDWLTMPPEDGGLLVYDIHHVRD